MMLGKTERGKRHSWRELWMGRWLVRVAGAACLEHLQIVPHEFHPICALICLPSRPTHDVSRFHYR